MGENRESRENRERTHHCGSWPGIYCKIIQVSANKKSLLTKVGRRRNQDKPEDLPVTLLTPGEVCLDFHVSENLVNID